MRSQIPHNEMSVSATSHELFSTLDELSSHRSSVRDSQNLVGFEFFSLNFSELDSQSSNLDVVRASLVHGENSEVNLGS